MAVKPIGSRILIEVRAGEEKTASGLYIPTAAQEKT
ncbi:MAG: co-chaperone GroES, partial [Brevinema sp.]